MYDQHGTPDNENLPVELAVVVIPLLSVTTALGTGLSSASMTVPENVASVFMVLNVHVVVRQRVHGKVLTDDADRAAGQPIEP